MSVGILRRADNSSQRTAQICRCAGFKSILAKQVLSQLTYASPNLHPRQEQFDFRYFPSRAFEYHARPAIS
jgi:hypothetical protein